MSVHLEHSSCWKG